MGKIATPPMGALLSIDLDAIVANYRIMKKIAGPTRVGAVVKADAYGLGASQVAPMLAKAGCEDFFVAHLSEAHHLRSFLADRKSIYILNGLSIGSEAQCAEIGAIPVLNSLPQIVEWRALAVASMRKLPAVLQLDTGMSRLGLSAEEISSIVAHPELLAPLEIRLVMSHLACADMAESPENRSQLDGFRSAAGRLPPVPLSLANSAGAFLGADYHFDLIRPGIALYGGLTLSDGTNPLKPVVRLEARPIQVRTIESGTGVGYGLTYRPTNRRRLCTVPIGYADGWPRHLGNVGSAFVDGVRVPIVGRISMDSMTLDISTLPDTDNPHLLGVELLGCHQGIEDVARDAGTISYEILTQLGRRYTRHYLADWDEAA